MSKTQIIDGKKYKIVGITACDGCAFFKRPESCTMPEDAEQNCGPHTIYKEVKQRSKVKKGQVWRHKRFPCNYRYSCDILDVVNSGRGFVIYYNTRNNVNYKQSLSESKFLSDYEKKEVEQ